MRLKDNEDSRMSSMYTLRKKGRNEGPWVKLLSPSAEKTNPKKEGRKGGVNHDEPTGTHPDVHRRATKIVLKRGGIALKRRQAQRASLQKTSA